MKFSIFKTPKAQTGEECTYERYLEIANSKELLQLCNEIAQESDANKRGELKKKLPVITWQAYFAGRRVAKEAIPSGLFMLDIDHVDNPYELYQSKICNRINELGIVYVGMTASQHGLRIVAKCLPTLSSIEDCQRWLASNLKVDYDGVCKDWARCSYLVHDSYTYYMNSGEIWMKEPEQGTVYATGANPVQINAEFEKALQDAATQGENTATTSSPSGTSFVDQREGLFGGTDEYKGIPYSNIIKEWFRTNGGEPEEGERNAKLYRLATRLRYICDFNEAQMLRIIPSYGLPQEEIKSLIHSACGGTRASSIPNDLQKIINRCKIQHELIGLENLEDETVDLSMPIMPPVIRQFVDAAPEDFKQAVALCQLPILGTLGSKLRAKYLDGNMHSPTFQVSLEAPQASGKSFMRKLVEYELAQILDHDEEQREKEREYDNKVREMKLLNVKINADNKDEILGSRPKSLIRYVPATMSITKLLMRMNDAQGLHLFAMAEEIDTVTKAFKRGFSSYSDLLRVAFDNGLYGQDYASENSFSGIIPIYYNFLTSGTPKAMRRFYPDVEDGLVSRVCFVTLPDQFGKKMPVWGKFGESEKAIVDVGLVRLNDISIQGDSVQDVHVMKMEWLNKELEQWILLQQAQAVKEDDRTRDIFCRRSAVVGFRAGMLAWFLYGEKNTPTIRRNTMRFAKWVANSMLNQHLLRFNIKSSNSNTNQWEEAFNMLKDVFTRDELNNALSATNVETKDSQVIYKWKLAGLIETIEKSNSNNAKQYSSKFKKIKK